MSVLVLSVMLMCICTISMISVLRILSIYRNTTYMMVEVSVKRGVLESASRLLEFSFRENRELDIELNGFELKTFLKDGKWCVSIDDGDYKKIMYAEGG